MEDIKITSVFLAGLTSTLVYVALGSLLFDVPVVLLVASVLLVLILIDIGFLLKSADRI